MARLTKEFRDYVKQKICREIITKEREVDVVSVEHLRGYI